MQGRKRPTADDRHTHVVGLFADFHSLLVPRQVADRAGDDGHLVAVLAEVPGQLVVTGAARFVQCGESLVDQQDVHIVNILLDKDGD